ncbi:MAG: cation transporter [Eggerthellaceae bacterium]|nr:cation transporter [Eggerthellaceae bacterium]
MSLFSKKETVKLEVSGMHCQKCVGRVSEALLGVDGVTCASVSLEDNTATAEGHGLEAPALVAAVEAAGYDASIAE